MKDKVINNIKTIRESKNFTAEYLATQLGISQSTYSRKENGETDFTLPELVKVSEALEVPLVKIIDLDLARVIQQTNNDHSTGIVENLHDHADGYKVAVTALEKDVEFLRQQVKDLMAMLAGKM